MFVLRSLFWFAVVALLMPRGPELGIALHRPAVMSSAQYQILSLGDRFEAVRAQIAEATARPEDDPVQFYRAMLVHHLAAVRVQLSEVRAQQRAGTAIAAILAPGVRLRD